ncbi:Ca(2+)-dependent cysteine protease [Blastocladiella emersonii ATCC 22665]|nr:Ca(2+)-dependent cysteine protease [Blastocladiella emersonii ATCC 22665]
MPNSVAICFGLNYPGTSGSLEGCDMDAYTMSDVAASMGIEDINTVTDTDAPITREQVLGSLREMVTSAQPGDTLLFSFAGHGGQTADQNGDEGDGKDEFIQCSDGPITDDEIRAILADLPEGANMTMVCDSCRSGTIADIDLGDSDIAGNVVVLSATAPHENSGDDPDGGLFSNALANVVANNPGVTWAEVAELIDAADGSDTQTANVSANRPELLYEPAFAPVAGEARDETEDESAPASGSMATEDRDGDGRQERIVETLEDGTVVDRVDIDGDGVTDVTATHYTDGTTMLEHDMNGDGYADTVAMFSAEGSVTYVSTDAPVFSDGAVSGDGYHETRLETNLDGTQSIGIDYDGDGVLETNADTNHDGLIDGAMDVNQDGASDLVLGTNLAGAVTDLAAIADINIGCDMCC